ncbi:Ni/Fe hydrogenase subunit alpha [Candidatus Woesearchaeota archaeon]|nr:Ni/Fe hydrogenase subunit alpha [Candidatus Woesearchaeota archaeon]
MGKISLNHITKIEGHARLDLEVKGSKLVKCELGSIEGSRYFEPLLKGRDYRDAPEITSRICGICSSAHGVASVMAMENALGIKATPQTIILRELQTIGERIRSHATHLYFLALPDYLGYESALAMTKKYMPEIQRALRLIKIGNEMVTAVSGRVMHQISTTIGGFTHFPEQEKLDEFRKRLLAAEKDIIDTAKLISSLKVPKLSTEGEMFSLSHETEYGTSHGFIKSGDSTFEQKDYSKLLKEYHEPYSNANFVVKKGKSYYVGALARVVNNGDRLSTKTQEFIKKNKIDFSDMNPFKNNLAQAIELIHYWEYTADLLTDFKVKYESVMKPKKKSGHGIAANEAPRGTLWHEYKVSKGEITYANVVTPTAQMLRNMQDMIAVYVQQMLTKKTKKEKIVLEVEKLIRSYDPCFSCATHFLTVNWK